MYIVAKSQEAIGQTRKSTDEKKTVIMTGMETLQKIKDALDTSVIPVILLTGQTSDEELLKRHQYGAAYCIPKLLTKTQLLNGIDLFCSHA